MKSAPRGSRGFTMIELLLVIAIIMIIAGMTVFGFLQSERNYRVQKDARAIASQLQVAKMKAVADFTWMRLTIDEVNRTFFMEKLDKDTGNWIADGGTVPLSTLVNYGFGDAADPPAGLGSLAQTQPVIFNSRGVPIDEKGNPAGDYAVYVTDGTRTFAVTVSATGRVVVWQFPPKGWSSL